MADAVQRYFEKLSIPKKGTIVITGGNSGIGLECAKFLARLDWHIVLAVRSLERGEKAKESILKQWPKTNVEVWELDLARRDSIDAFIRKLKETKLDVDVFYANAGIYRMPFSSPFSGLESHIAVNCASNYLLYRGLKDHFHGLGHEVKFVLTSSMVARFARCDVSELAGAKHYHPMRAYEKSKVMVNALYLYLVEQEQGSNVLPLLAHPGSTYTPLIAKAYPGKKIRIAAERFMRIFFHTPRKAALSTMRLLCSDVKTPCFCAPRGIFHVSGYPKMIHLYKGNLKNREALIQKMAIMLGE